MSIERPPSAPRQKTLSSSGDAADQRQQQRRARRAQFRDFYGIKGIEEGGGQQQQQGQAEEEGRDGSSKRQPFDSSAYYNKLIAESSLVDLMQQAGKLSTDVGNLHSARHALVYNHHHQLFSAGDTIQVLNRHTPQLLSIVTSLQDSFSSISQLVDSVALPDSAMHAATNREDIDGQRLALMLQAEESPERIRPVFERYKDQILQQSESGDQTAKDLLERCQRVLPLSTTTDSLGQAA